MSKRVGRPKIDEDEHVKYNDRITCETCKGVYSRSNKSAHEKTKQHQQALKYEKIIKNTLQQQIPDRMTLLQRAEYPYYDWNGERIYMTKNKFNYYNTVSMAKNGYPLYFNSLSERKQVMREQAENESDEIDSETSESENETDEEQDEDITSSESESDSDDENSTVIVPDWFVKKIDDPNTTRKELKKMVLIYNDLATKQGVKPVKRIK